jgi:hypothetical protein
MKGAAFAGLVIIIVLLMTGAFALLFLNSGRQGNSTVTAPTFPGYPAVATDSNATIGIDLSLALNSTRIVPGQGQDLQTVVEVLNALSRVNNVSVANDFPIKPLLHKCLPGDYTPVVIQMYAGNYGRNNISSASPLQYILTCPPVSSISITEENYYLFQPNSAYATLYGRNQASNLTNTGPISLYLVSQISIYQFSSSFPNGTFPTGKYTLMVEDFWGQIVILPFTIAS